MTRVVIFFLWLLHLLPQWLLVPFGHGVGRVLYWLIAERRQVTLTNLRLCFPEMSEVERVRFAKRHFALYGRTFVERAVLWWSSPARIRELEALAKQEKAWANV